MRRGGSAARGPDAIRGKIRLGVRPPETAAAAISGKVGNL